LLFQKFIGRSNIEGIGDVFIIGDGNNARNDNFSCRDKMPLGMGAFAWGLQKKRLLLIY
jgi:hypothetical protein